MKRFQFLGLLLLAPLLMGSGEVDRSTSVKEAVESAKLLAQFFDLGRVVVGEFQATINDPAKGDKGFTPDVFGQHVTQKFEHETRGHVGTPCGIFDPAPKPNSFCQNSSRCKRLSSRTGNP